MLALVFFFFPQPRVTSGIPKEGKGSRFYFYFIFI